MSQQAMSGPIHQAAAPLVRHAVGTIVADHGVSAPGWTIAEYVVDELGHTRFAVFHGEQRKAWGLRDRDSADRWVERLTLLFQASLVLMVTPSHA
jgi:hypothetical protein